MGRQVYCDVCSCYIPSAALVPSHEEGKKHQQLLRRKEKKLHSEMSSIFVSGFPKFATVESELEQKLSVFGEIKEIYLDKNNHSYAIVEFEDPKSVQNALGSTCKIDIGDKPLVIKPRTSKDRDKKVDNREYSNIGKADSNSSGELSPDSLLQKLNEIDNVGDQMKWLMTETEVTAGEKELRRLIATLLCEVFVEAFPDATLTIFGSSESETGIKGCDLDVSLISKDLAPFPNQGPFKVKDKSPQRQFSELVSAKLIKSSEQHEIINLQLTNQITAMSPLSDVKVLEPKLVEKDVTSEEEETASVDSCIDVITTLLHKFAPGCKSIFALKTAHCPLIRFLHSDSGLKVDLSINNRLAIENTLLFRSYIDTDARVRPLLYTIRAWARSKRLYGKGGKQITGYALTLLVIFFLQRCHPPVLPCLQDRKMIETYSKAFSEYAPKIIDGWDCYFESQHTWKSSNTMTEGQLLETFFKFSSEFDFTKELITIRTLFPCDRKTFLSELETFCGKDSFKVTALCIQDPFELNHNLAQNLSLGGLQVLKEQFLAAHKMFVSNPAFIASESTSVENSDGEQCRGSINLVNLLALSEKLNQQQGVKRKRKTCKYIFDIPAVGEISCSTCARVALEILQIDLRMQCRWEETQSLIQSSVQQRLEKSLNNGGSTFVDPCPMLNRQCAQPTANEKPEKECHDLSAKRRKLEKEVSNTVTLLWTNEKSNQSVVRSEVSTPLFSENVDLIQITATAWANTWIKRRQQRRLLSGKYSSGSDAREQHGDGDSVPSSSQSDISSPVITSSDADSASSSLIGQSLDRPEVAIEEPDGISKDCSSSSCREGRSVLSVAIKIANMKDKNPKLSTRFVVKIINANDLSIFQTFFAYFKKRVLFILNKYKSPEMT